jgi:uncharacterized protein
MLPVGGPATGDDFIDRINETKLILQKIEKDNVILVAPRRFGKTSIMLRVKDELETQRKKAIFLEVENIRTPAEFITEMIMSLTEIKNKTHNQIVISLLEKSGSWIEAHFAEIETPVIKATLRGKILSELNEDWQSIAKKFISTLSDSNERIYFVIDEFPIAIQNMKIVNAGEAKQFLQWFRKLRTISRNVKFLVGGSVSIDNIVREAGGIALINDFDRVKIDGFEKTVALSVSKQIIGKKYRSEIGEKILGCIGEPYIPYFLMITLSQINDEHELHGEKITEDLVEIVYNKKILGSQGRHYFQHYSDRLVERCNYSEMGEKVSRAILGKICLTDYYDIELAFGVYKQETGDADRSKFMDLIANLENDFYIEVDRVRGLKFYSKMLSDWWRIYHVSIN